MERYLARRLVLLIPVALGVTMVTFFLVRLIPGDPAVIALGDRATSESVTRLQHQMGLLGGALSFLGLGVQPPSPEWGLMIAEGRNFLVSAPGMVLFPGIALLLTGIALNLLGDTLADRLRPGR